MSLNFVSHVSRTGPGARWHGWLFSVGQAVRRPSSSGLASRGTGVVDAPLFPGAAKAGDGEWEADVGGERGKGPEERREAERERGPVAGPAPPRGERGKLGACRRVLTPRQQLSTKVRGAGQRLSNSGSSPPRPLHPAD